MCGAQAHVRFGSKADICAAKSDARFTPYSDRKSGHPLFAHALNYALACQHMHFVTGIAEERSEHFVRMLPKRRRSVIGIEGGFAQVNGTLNSLHGASTRVRHLGNHIP